MITPFQGKVTKTATFTGGNVPISAMSQPVEIHLRLWVEGNDTIATFSINVSTDTPTPFATTNILTWARSFKLRPTVDAPFEIVLKEDVLSRFLSLVGTTNANARLVLADIAGTSPTVTYEAFIVSGG